MKGGKMSDPIERQDVLNLLDSVSQYMGNWLIQYIEEGISSIPPAQPEQVCIANVTLTDEQVKEVVEKAKSAVISVIKPDPQWIPCTDPAKLPKNKELWITCEICGCRVLKEIYWDMTEWSDDVSGLIAYMPYVVPKPYREERRTDETD